MDKEAEITNTEASSPSIPVSKVTEPKKSPANRLSLIIIAVLLALIIFIGGYLFAQKGNLKKEIMPTPSQSAQTVSPTVMPTITQVTSSPTLTSKIEENGKPNQKIYTNYKYGFKFIFPTQLGEEVIDLKEISNKIYVYNTKYPYTQGQYIEIFEKSESDTLDQAIQKQLLTNISPKDCFVKDAKPDSSAAFPSSYQVKTLSYPVDENSDVPVFAQTNKCPSPYAATNGLSYFLGDSNHPKAYLFFSIGQYAITIESQSSKPWQDTIEFL